MQTQLLDIITTHFGPDFADKIEFSPVPRGQSGDLAMKFFALAKETKQSPIELAKQVQEKLATETLIEKTEIAGPYLNLFFASEFFFGEVLNAPISSPAYQNKTVVVEFSGPNTNKPLHLGHMRNHALGIALSNLYEACGANIKRVNIINDRGVHICKSMLAYDRFGNGETPEQTGEKSDAFVGRYYVKFSQEAKKDESLKDEIQAMLVKWEQGDKDVRALWQKMNDWTINGHAETYKRQGIKFDKAYKESDHYEKGVAFAQEGLKSGVFKQREDGTIYIDLSDHDMGEKVVLRADGTAIYLTQDLSLWPLRLADYGPNISEMVYVVGDEQNYYFKTVFISLEKLGLKGNTDFFHLGYGLVHLPDGRMKSREGTVVDADPTMNELHDLAYAEIRKRNADLDDNQAHTIAEQIQNAAWKFYLLSTSPRKTITFDKENSIKFEGATGPYLQYAGVRMKSIFRKATEEKREKRKEKSTKSPAETSYLAPLTSHFIALLGKPEKPLGVKILEFQSVIERATETKNPTYLVTYLLELAQDWSSYYANNSILNAETKELKQARLALAHKTYTVLEKGLAILGIEIPEVM